MENEEKKYNLENPNEEPVKVDEEPLVLEANKSAQNIEEMNVKRVKTLTKIGKIVMTALTYVFLVFIAIIVIFPFYWM